MLPETGQAQTPENHHRDLEFPGAPLSLDSPLYVPRSPVEEQIYQAVEKPGSVIRIQAPRRMGKSSLLTRVLTHAETLGYQVAKLDFQTADEAVFSHPDKFLRWFSSNVSRKLRLPPRLDDYWDSEIGSKVSCTFYFEDYVLEQSDRPLVLALNEVNLVFEQPEIAKDFLPLLRYWHEQSKQVEAFQKLRLVIVHSTEVYVPLQIHQSPFNVGLPIKLTEFNLAQTQDLARRYGLDWGHGEEEAVQLTALLSVVGGSPYRLSLAFYYLARGELTLAEVLQTAASPLGIYGNHLQDLLVTLQQDPNLKDALGQVMTQDRVAELDPIATYKLNSLGLVKLGEQGIELSCELYRRYFQSQFMPSGSTQTAVTESLAPLQPEPVTVSTPVPVFTKNSILLGGRYCRLDQLGQGGFGTTYLAEDTHRPGNPQCVIKQLAGWFNPEDLADARRLFATEAQTLEQLGNHEQIPRLLAYFEQEDNFYIVQEFVLGTPLSQEMVNQPPWSASKAIDFLLSILPVLDFVHQHQTIHRDIKPDNIMRRQRDGQLILIDFGVAKKLMRSSPTQPQRTVAVGTWGYAPLEQQQGHPQFNSDLYALGVTTIQGLTACPPDQLPRTDALELDWRSLADPELNPWLATLLEGMVKQNYQERYQSAAEVLADLRMITGYG